MANAFLALETDVTTGRRTALGEVAARAIDALNQSGIPYAVIGATALAVRGHPRFTADLDIVIALEDAFNTIAVLENAGFSATTPVERDDEPEPMYVLVAQGIDVDVLVAAGEPESTVIAEATRVGLFGTEARVATLEHLLLMYLYSNQPRHLGDFASIVASGKADLVAIERYLSEVHQEMLPDFRTRVRNALHPAPSPERPKRR